MAYTEQDFQELKARLQVESQGVCDVPDAEKLDGITSLPAYQSVGNQGMPEIVKAPLTLLAAPALEAAGKANAAAANADEKAGAANEAAQKVNYAADRVEEAVRNATVAAEAANAATASANQATTDANRSAGNADEKAQTAQEAADNAADTANHPTYIGKDHYAYKWNKTTKVYDKTDVYCKGEPGSPLRIAGAYETLEALQAAIPDGSDVDGFMAVGTKVPYNYYVWVNGGWVDQGQIIENSDVLTKTNTTAYTPTADYHPATKKYAEAAAVAAVDNGRSAGYTMSLTTIDATGLDGNTWYPVVMRLGNEHTVRIEVTVGLNSRSVPSWSTHEQGFSVRKIWEVNGSGWGSSSVNRDILVSDYGFADVDPVRGMGQLTNHSDEYVYVRGGGRYFFYTSHNVIPVLHTTTYSNGQQSVSPTVEAPAVIYRTAPVVIIPAEVYGANDSISSEELLAAWRGVDNFRRAARQAADRNSVVILKNSDESLPSNTAVSNRSRYTDDNNFVINVAVIRVKDNRYLYIEYGIYLTNGRARLMRSTTNLVGGSSVSRIIELSKAEYDALPSKDHNTLYIIPA
ncbi:hypothetical protein [uncultured Bacteroides sp.]|uniref:phage upper tail fiber protein n=1 Tax=uncultured Bacteroides sp. TaxID=162156 RepID=UPI0025EC941C|nr:hypothetical protein [uncultured Bacteroides sp.]